MRDELLIMVGTLLNLLVSSSVLSKLVRTIIDNAVNHLTVGMWLSLDRKVPDRPHRLGPAAISRKISFPQPTKTGGFANNW